jgi:hypothetical protein
MARLLTLVAPFRCPFCLDNALAAEDSAEFHAFLTQMSRDLRLSRTQAFPGMPQGVEISAVVRRREADVESRYVGLDAPANASRSPKYLSLAFCGAEEDGVKERLREAARDADMRCGRALSESLVPIPSSVDVGIYDNTIAVLALDAEMAPEFAGEDWDKLDEWTTHLVFYFLGGAYGELILPAIKAVNAYAARRSGGRVLSPSQYAAFGDMEEEEERARLLWVNRTLCCPENEASSAWARRVTEGREPIVADQARAYLGWGNNVVEIEDADGACHLHGLREGMCFAQYYYAVADVMGRNLNRFVADSYDRRSNRSLRRLSRRMEAAVDAVSVFQVKYKDACRELQGLSRDVFKRLEREWEFDALFLSVREKSGLCRENLHRLNACINQRNSVRVQMVLAIVAGMGIVNMMMNLSSYGRNLKKEAYTSDVAGLLDVGQTLSPDAMIWIGVMLALSVSAFVAANRPR